MWNIYVEHIPVAQVELSHLEIFTIPLRMNIREGQHELRTRSRFRERQLLAKFYRSSPF